jgi:hypothetical protein
MPPCNTRLIDLRHQSYVPENAAKHEELRLAGSEISPPREANAFLYFAPTLLLVRFEQ